MNYSGSCACGAVTSKIEGQPIIVRQCWCRQCQQIAAGSAASNAMFLTSQITLEGELKWHRYTAASGNTLAQGFCPACGTAIIAHSSARPQFRTIRLGFLDVPNDLQPSMVIWTEDAPDWAIINPELEQYSQQAPPPQLPAAHNA